MRRILRRVRTGLTTAWQALRGDALLTHEWTPGDRR